MYSVGLYQDRETRRTRYAVYCGATGVWYFANRYGQEAAARLCNRLNSILRK